MKSLFQMGAMTLFVSLMAGFASAQTEVSLRAPSVPLVPIDPFFSIWSAADKLTDAGRTGEPSIRHWTGAPNQLTSLVNVDGTAYRIMGIFPRQTAALEQKSVTIKP